MRRPACDTTPARGRGDVPVRPLRSAPGAPRRRPAALRAAALLLLCSLLAVLAAAPGAIGAGQPDPPFPRTLGMFLTQDQLPGSASCTPGSPSPLDPSVLGRFDAVVIDAEWSNAARLSCYSPSAFDQIRAWAAANSDGRGITILPYVNPVDRPGVLGSNGYYQYRYDMWGCLHSVTFGTCAFPKQWLAHTAKGQLYSEYRGTWMTNLTDAPQPGTMPADTSSTSGSFTGFGDYFGTWVRNRWNDSWSSIWDGVYLDVWGDRIWSNTSPWDPYWGGPLDAGKKKKTNYATSVIYADPPAGSGPSTPSGLWQRGIAAGNATIQGTPPADAPPILIANNTQSATTAPGENGRLWESFADPALGRQWLWDVPGYVNAGGPNPLGFGTRTVSGTTYLMAVDGQFPAPGSLGAADYQRARFDLGSALLGDGYWGAATTGYDAPLYFDEMDGGTLHQRGYLGQAVDPQPPSWAKLSAAYVTSGKAGYTGEGRYANGVYRRDFANGVVLVNPSSATQTVALETTLYHLKGLRTTSPNDGRAVTSVTLAKNDAVVLVSTPPPTG